MSDINVQVAQTLLELLCSEYGKTAAHLTAELRVEHPDLYQKIMDWQAREYNLSGCGTQMSPATVVSQALSALHISGQAQMSHANGNRLWHKR
ncbi:MAG: hypothetical protein SCK29_00705 [Bacillota bacterium]|nr:hypothetical protein [Bacillota bacterium]MDW7682622.1 hypothetical protein [Bacillota bacterium]